MLFSNLSLIYLFVFACSFYIRGSCTTHNPRPSVCINAPAPRSRKAPVRYRSTGRDEARVNRLSNVPLTLDPRGNPVCYYVRNQRNGLWLRNDVPSLAFLLPAGIYSLKWAEGFTSRITTDPRSEFSAQLHGSGSLAPYR